MGKNISPFVLSLSPGHSESDVICRACRNSSIGQTRNIAVSGLLSLGCGGVVIVVTYIQVTVCEGSPMSWLAAAIKQDSSSNEFLRIGLGRSRMGQRCFVQGAVRPLNTAHLIPLIFAMLEKCISSMKSLMVGRLGLYGGGICGEVEGVSDG